MTSYVLSAAARSDLRRIWAYIARDNPRAADGFEAQLMSAMESLAYMPGMGMERSDWTRKRLRFWPVDRYIIAYWPEEKPLRVARIISAYRDIRAVL